jgi:hypothetical protein
MTAEEWRPPRLQSLELAEGLVDTFRAGARNRTAESSGTIESIQRGSGDRRRFQDFHLAAAALRDLSEMLLLAS